MEQPPRPPDYRLAGRPHHDYYWPCDDTGAYAGPGAGGGASAGPYGPPGGKAQAYGAVPRRPGGGGVADEYGMAGRKGGVDKPLCNITMLPCGGKEIGWDNLCGTL